MQNSTTAMWVLVGSAAIVVLAAPSARAQDRLVADVPFDFIVGQSHLPAGRYIVSESDNPAVVSVANETGHGFAFVLTIGSAAGAAVTQPELVFEKFDGKCFLARIEPGGDGGREIPLKPSTMEREVDRVAAAWLP